MKEGFTILILFFCFNCYCQDKIIVNIGKDAFPKAQLSVELSEVSLRIHKWKGVSRLFIVGSSFNKTSAKNIDIATAPSHKPSFRLRDDGSSQDVASETKINPTKPALNKLD